MVPLPDGKKVVGSRFTYTIKTTGDGQWDRDKARFIVQGFTMVPGVDYTKTWVVVASKESSDEDDSNEDDPNEGDSNENNPNKGNPNKDDPNEGSPNENNPNEGDPDEGGPDSNLNTQGTQCQSIRIPAKVSID